MNKKDKGLVWLQTNLRLQSNSSIEAAASACKSLAFLYILPEHWFEPTSWGFARIGEHRLRFLVDSLKDLKRNLEKEGHSLCFRRGNPEELIPALIQEYGFDSLFAQQIYASEEQKVLKSLHAGLQIPIHLSDDNYLYRPDQLPFDLQELPEMFTRFRNSVERKPLKGRMGKLVDLNQNLSFELYSEPFPELTCAAHPWFAGGESAGMKHLKNYLNSGHVRHYKETRNGMIEKEESSKLSPWLALGCLNAHTVLALLQEHEEEEGANESTYWLWFELLWRDYFRLVAARFGNALFLPGGIQGKRNKMAFKKTVFERFVEGRTPEPFVNANMNELRLSGWMSNRGRQNVASFWVHDLGMDWRAAAAWFEHSLIDYDVASNYGNWMYVAGVGNDPRPNRKFNIRKQAEQYDAEGRYQQKWANR